MAKAYYNEIDPYAAQWLRNLIDAGHIAFGDVDTRSIVDVKASDLTGYTQCHFFAGIGVWSYALRQSGWSDSRPVWTGSCPCQPFSVAGAGEGVSDERHLWPVWFELIKQCRPDVVFGEQVESAIKYGWLDLVQSDVERENYILGAAGIPAAGVGAPHIRHRLYFVAQSPAVRRRGGGDGNTTRYSGQVQTEGRGSLSELADADSRLRVESDETIRAGGIAVNSSRQSSELANDIDAGSQGWVRGGAHEGRQDQHGHVGRNGTTGFWAAADWIDCKDGKTRPVEPSTFPLAYGAPARVGRLRAYGNAIVPQVAQAFIEAYLET
jgi:DNA (cytosine-5)-methyltransferase 1